MEKENTEISIQTLQFLVTKSEYIINSQLESQRAKESNSGVIIAVIALFVPFFLNGLSDSKITLQLMAIIPLGGLIIALILLLYILAGTPIMRSIRPEKFEDLVVMKINDVLLNDLGANLTCYRENMKLYKRIKRIYSWAILFTITSVIFSVILLAIDTIVKNAFLNQKI